MPEPQTPNRRRQHGRTVHLLALAAILCNAGGNSMLRVGLSAAGPIVSIDLAAYSRAFANAWVVAGIVVLAAWLILQLSLLSWADLTYVLPVTSAAYVLIAILGAVVLRERVSPAHWCGVGLILAGVIIVGRTNPLTGEREDE